jgi:hypothetical protein
MSDWTAGAVWNLFRILARSHRRVLTYAGPTAILAIIVSWAVLVWFGFALIYLPHLATGFTHLSAGEPASEGGVLEAMAVSLGALISLSEGTYAKLHWLELARGSEAIFGFGLLTASVSWLLSIYPVLEARRSLAQRATLLDHAERANRLDLVRDSPGEARTWILDLGAALATLRNQMSQFPITYYFDLGEPETKLAGVLPYLLELAERAQKTGDSGLTIAGTVLGGAVDSFLELVAADFLTLSTADKTMILRAYAREQMSEMSLHDRRRGVRHSRAS